MQQKKEINVVETSWKNEMEYEQVSGTVPMGYEFKGYGVGARAAESLDISIFMF